MAASGLMVHAASHAGTYEGVGVGGSPVGPRIVLQQRRRGA
jgi:hypothetical protein